MSCQVWSLQRRCTRAQASLAVLHSIQNCSRNIECRKIQRRYSWSYRSVISATAKLWSHLSTWQCKRLVLPRDA
jgi:hypothetical protein